jgi:hypothetical protein
MGGTPPFKPEPDPVSKPKSAPRPSNQSMNMPVAESMPAMQQATHVSLPNWDEDTPKAKSKAAARPKPGSKTPTEKPLVFKYSLITQIVIYLLAAVFLCSFLLAFQDTSLLLVPCGLSFLALPAVWIVSSQVEVSNKGIRTSRLFGLVNGSQVGWEEIARIKSNSMQRNLELITKTGNSVKVTSQVSGYPTIVETLRQKRPDLFGMKSPSSRQGNFSAPEYGEASSNYVSKPAPEFSGTKTFKKSFFKQYGLLFLVIPFCLFALWTAYVEPQYRIGAILSAVFCLILIILPFFQVGSVKVEPNKLTVETFIEQKEFSARQIKEIKMQSVRGRRGSVTNFVNIVTAQGKNYPLQGFSDGDELIYGFLINWWESYRSR